MSSDADNAMLRMTIIGMILRFQQSSQEALHDVLEDKIPFLFSSILNFNEHSSSGDSMVIIVQMRILMILVY